MNTMALYYDPYKNDPIVSFMSFKENYINMNEKVEKIVSRQPKALTCSKWHQMVTRAKLYHPVL